MSIQHMQVPWAVGLLLLASVYGVHGEILTRESAIALAVQHNLEIKAARAEVDAARARSASAWAPPNPALGAEFEQLRRLGDPGDFGERSIGITQTIESPAKWWLRRRAAELEAGAAHQSIYEATRFEVSNRVSVAFDRVLSRQRKLTFEVEHDSLLQNFAHKARLRFEAGDVPVIEVLRAEVESGRAASRLAAAQNELAAARVQLTATIMYNPDGKSGDLELRGSLNPSPPSVSLAELQQLGLLRRADLQGAITDLESRRAHRGASRAGLFPDLTVGVARQTLRQAGESEARWALGLSLEIPLWAAARERANLAEARAQVVSGQARVEGLRQQVLAQVEMAYLSVMSAADQVKLFDERVMHAAKVAQQSATDSYEQGKATYLEVLDSQRTLIMTRSEYVDIVFAHREAWAALERAVGETLETGGLQ